MNETTLFLAQILGPVFSIMGLGMIANSEFYFQMYSSLNERKFEMMIFAMAMIPIGIAMLLKHFLWGNLPEIIVSFLGLVIFIKGLFMGVLPKFIIKLTDNILSKTLLMIGGTIWIIFGVYLIWVSYF